MVKKRERSVRVAMVKKIGEELAKHTEDRRRRRAMGTEAGGRRVIRAGDGAACCCVVWLALSWCLGSKAHEETAAHLKLKRNPDKTAAYS